MTVSRIAWFEREFALGLPSWMFPNIIERLRGTPARVAEMARPLAPGVLARRDGERWSIQEHVGHLFDLGWLDLARVEDFKAGREMLTAADMMNRKTHEAQHNSRTFSDVFAAFRTERADFVRRLEAFDEEMLTRAALHPRIKQPMRPTDFAYFVAEHDDHHLAAISELIRKFAS
jgi:uncharacterized damage-inducible protein DinB